MAETRASVDAAPLVAATAEAIELWPQAGGGPRRSAAQLGVVRRASSPDGPTP